mmetsp:Transcript_6391/g.10104  ORF Transcript_6391/g.10104 Transcript_6391/m.10104 type:complete len:253 (+) Transcript_6391:99-857(+)
MHNFIQLIIIKLISHHALQHIKRILWRNKPIILNVKYFIRKSDFRCFGRLLSKHRQTLAEIMKGDSHCIVHVVTHHIHVSGILLQILCEQRLNAFLPRIIAQINGLHHLFHGDVVHFFMVLRRVKHIDVAQPQIFIHERTKLSRTQWTQHQQLFNLEQRETARSQVMLGIQPMIYIVLSHHPKILYGSPPRAGEASHGWHTTKNRIFTLCSIFNCMLRIICWVVCGVGIIITQFQLNGLCFFVLLSFSFVVL